MVGKGLNWGEETGEVWIGASGVKEPPQAAWAPVCTTDSFRLRWGRSWPVTGKCTAQGGAAWGEGLGLPFLRKPLRAAKLWETH